MFVVVGVGVVVVVVVVAINKGSGNGGVARGLCGRLDSSAVGCVARQIIKKMCMCVSIEFYGRRLRVRIRLNGRSRASAHTHSHTQHTGRSAFVPLSDVRVVNNDEYFHVESQDLMPTHTR